METKGGTLTERRGKDKEERRRIKDKN